MSDRTWVAEPAKPTPVAADRVLILDSADSDNNKLVTLSSLPGTEFFGPWTATHDAGGFDLINVGLLNLKIDNATAIMELEANHTVPAVGQIIGQIDFYDDNDVGARELYSQIQSIIFDPTNNNESAELRLSTFQLGVPISYIRLNEGGGDDITFIRDVDFSTNNINNITDIGLLGNITFPDNIRQLFNPGATVAGINVGAVAVTDPSTLVDADIWYNTTDTTLKTRVGGVTADLLTTISQYPDGDAIRTSAAKFVFEEADVTYNASGELLLNSSDTIIQISRPSDIEDLATANVFTLTGDTTIIYNLAFSSPVRFELNGFVLQIWNTMQNHIWTYTGGGTFISGRGSIRLRTSSRFDGDGTGTLLNIRLVGTFNIDAVRVSNWASGGTTNGSVFLFRVSSHLLFSDAFNIRNGRFTDINSTIINDFPLSNSPFKFEGEDLQSQGRILNVGGNMEPTTTLVRIDPAIRADALFNFNGNTIVGELFDNVITNSGTFTAVADAAIASTSITSVTDSSGKAQFNFAAGPTVFVGQRVTLSGYVTNTDYNVTAIVLTTDGTTFFTLTYIDFGTDEASGSFTSDSVTITETATSAIEAESIFLDTDLALDYDLGSKVYNKLTNSFQVNAAFTVTKTGTWNNAGLDQTNPIITANANPGHEDSEVLGGFFAVAQDLQNITVSFADLDFATGVTVLDAEERMKLIDTGNGEIVFTGTAPENLIFTLSLPYDKTSGGGGISTFQIKYQIDRGAGYVDIPQGPVALMSVNSSSDAFTASVIATVAVEPLDTIKMQIIRINGSDTELAIKPMRFEVTRA